MCKRQNWGYNASIINTDQAYDLKTIILPLQHKKHAYWAIYAMTSMPSYIVIHNSNKHCSELKRYIGFSKNLMFFTIYDVNLFLQNKF